VQTASSKKDRQNGTNNERRKQPKHENSKNTTEKHPHKKQKTAIYTNMKNFRQMEKLILEGDPARNLEEPRMRLASEPTTMSRFSKGLKHRTPYGTYDTQNYDRYKTSETSEADAHKATQTLRSLVYSDIPQNLEKLANFQDNDDIIKTYDEFLTSLYHKAGIKF